MAVDTQEMFRRAKAAVDGGNYDYATELLREILRMDPNHIKARVALRGCARKRFDEGGGNKVSGVLKGIVPYLRIHLNMNKPNKAIEACEDFLRGDPYNVHVLTLQGKAARRAKHVDLAACTFEDIRQRAPGHIHTLRNLAEIYENDKGDAKAAIRYYAEIQALIPSDGMVTKKLKDLQATAHLTETKMEEQKSFRDSIKDSDKQEELADKDRIVRSEDQLDVEIQRAQEQLAKEPESVPYLTKLGDLYAQKRDLKSAIATYEKAIKVDPQNFSAKQKIGDIKLKHGADRMGQMAAKLAENPDNQELKTKIEAGKKQLAAFQVQEFTWRTDAHPTDLPLKADFGDALLAAGQIDEAIAQFQAAQDNPRIRTRCRTALGTCFMHKGQYDLAMSQFERALETYTMLNDEAKGAHYNYGICAERMGDIDNALEHYKEIYEADIKFRDVGTKIEELSKQKRSQS